MGQLHVPATLHNTRDLVLAQRGHFDTAHVHTLDTEALVDTGANLAIITVTPVRK